MADRSSLSQPRVLVGPISNVRVLPFLFRLRVRTGAPTSSHQLLRWVFRIDGQGGSCHIIVRVKSWLHIRSGLRCCASFLRWHQSVIIIKRQQSISRTLINRNLAMEMQKYMSIFRLNDQPMSKGWTSTPSSREASPHYAQRSCQPCVDRVPEDAGIGRYYETPIPQLSISLDALKGRIRHHYEVASEYYKSLW